MAYSFNRLATLWCHPSGAGPENNGFPIRLAVTKGYHWLLAHIRVSVIVQPAKTLHWGLPLSLGTSRYNPLLHATVVTPALKDLPQHESHELQTDKAQHFKARYFVLHNRFSSDSNLFELGRPMYTAHKGFRMHAVILIAHAPQSSWQTWVGF
ncbi:hypothetical protein RRG08_012320 [Elysia crispata]|uniref:Uncharacterized protein n=1 Tax=Elysia crispata TaxID=231223 RepID=A0AAE1BCH9_9GAST|nr:hypothetical protein RRG08_012320 [Elysia crispata]